MQLHDMDIVHLYAMMLTRYDTQSQQTAHPPLLPGQALHEFLRI